MAIQIDVQFTAGSFTQPRLAHDMLVRRSAACHPDQTNRPTVANRSVSSQPEASTVNVDNTDTMAT